MLLLDFSNLAKAAITANLYNIPVTESPEGMSMVRHVALSSIMNYRKKFSKYGEPLIIADSATGYWRKDIFPEYKGTRDKNQEDSIIDWKFVSAVTKIVLKELKDNFPWAVIQVDKAEADDIIGILSGRASEPTMIVSGDQDSIQSHKNPWVKQWSPIQAYHKNGQGDITAENTTVALQSLITKIVKGDSGDGIPNVLSASVCLMEGIKQTSVMQNVLDRYIECPSTSMLEGISETLIDECTVELEELEVLQEAKATKGRGEKIDGIKKKIDIYTKSIERIKLNRELIDFDYIRPDIIEAVNLGILNQEIIGSPKKAMDYMIAKKLNQLLNRLDEF